MNSIITGLLEAGHQVKILAINNEKFHVKESDIPPRSSRIDLQKYLKKNILTWYNWRCST